MMQVSVMCTYVGSSGRMCAAVSREDLVLYHRDTADEAKEKPSA